MLRDFVYAVRTLRAGPAFAAAAVLTLALGIGAGTAIFSVADAVLLRPLPYKDPGRLVYACADMVKRNVYDYLWSNANYKDLRDHVSGLEDAAGVTTGRALLLHEDGAPEEVPFAAVTPNLFRLLGARIVMGRDFLAADGLPQPATANGAPPPPDRALPTFAIASYEFFERRFGGKPSALGQPMMKNGPILVGVLEPGFELLFRPDKNIERRPDYYVAARLDYSQPRVALTQRVVARLRPGVSLARAQSEADAVAAQVRAIDPTYSGANLRMRLEPMQPYLVSQARPAILALMGAVIFLLLIACSNVANLFLVRASLRSRDLAVRTAMGASWWRLARQMLAEALLVAALGSALGFALAWAGIHDLLAIAPANLPRADAIRVDPTALGFSIAAGLLAALLFGLAPAIRSARPDVAQVLRAAGRSSSGLAGGSFLRNAMVVAQVALCFVLLVGSGLMFRSFLALQRIDPGFDPHHLLIFRTTGGRPVRGVEPRAAAVRQMHDALAAIPGVETVTAANAMPLAGHFFPYRWGKADALTDFSKFQSADVQTVLPGYFAAMRTPLLAGRVFNEDDNNPKARRLVIDQQLAAKAFPGANAVGQRILMRFTIAESEWYEIVGVVAHQRFTSLADPGREQAYLPDGFWGHQFVAEWALRTQGDPGRYAGAVRAAMTRFDPSMYLADVQTMDAAMARAETSTRFSMLLIAAFAVIAALLAGVGLYGVLSTMVRQRTAELGLRMALGAAPSGVFGLMIAYGLRLSAVGVGAGFLAALLLTRAIGSMLVGTTPTDPLTFASMAALFFVVAALATGIPARRAAALDPSTALRQE